MLQLGVCLEETGSTSNLHNLLQATFQELKVKAGFNPNEGRWDMAVASNYVTTAWTTELIAALEDRQVYISDQTANLPMHTTDDIFLMDQFIHAG